MKLQSHFILMSDYNQRINSQIYNVVKELGETQINADRGAYFKSIIATLNHLFVGDLIWLARFSLHCERYLSLQALSVFPQPTGLDNILFANFTSLFEARKKVDLLLCKWLKNEVQENDFNGSLRYCNSKGVVSERDFGELVSHLFNHQTHHRGQLSTLLNQMGYDIGVTDFLLEIPEKQGQ